MKTSWGWIGGLGLVCLSAWGISTDSGYQTIPQKNIFRLKEPPVEQPTNLEPVALPKMLLTGITTIFGNRMALFRVQYPGRPGEPAKEESLVLAEGQRDGGIEVLGVDEVRKEVRVNNSGTEMTLTFEKDGVKPAAGPAVAAASGAPGAPNQTPPAPGSIGTGANPAISPPSVSGTPRRFGLGRNVQLPNAPTPPPMPPTTTVTPPPSPAALGAPAAAAEAQAAGVAKQLTPEEEQLFKLLEEKGQAPR